MTTSSNENETKRLVEEARREARWDERWKWIEASLDRSERALKEARYWREVARGERR
jgi:hypothetical protein